MAMNSRVQVPAAAKRGEVIEIRIAIQHPMENGFRYDAVGRPIPKNVINELICRYNGEQVFRAEMGSGIAANPYLSFFVVAQQSGEFEFQWVDDQGTRGEARALIRVDA